MYTFANGKSKLLAMCTGPFAPPLYQYLFKELFSVWSVGINSDMYRQVTLNNNLNVYIYFRIIWIIVYYGIFVYYGCICYFWNDSWYIFMLLILYPQCKNLMKPLKPCFFSAVFGCGHSAPPGQQEAVSESRGIRFCRPQPLHWHHQHLPLHPGYCGTFPWMK